MNNVTTYNNPAVVAALPIALAILTSNLDEDTKKRIKKAVEEMEMNNPILQSMDDTPFAEMFKSQMQTVRSLLNIK